MEPCNCDDLNIAIVEQNLIIVYHLFINRPRGKKPYDKLNVFLLRSVPQLIKKLWVCLETDEKKVEFISW